MRSDRDILMISIFTFITVVVWIFVELVHTAQTPITTEITEEMLAPMPPPIDQQVLRQVDLRTAYPEL